MRAGESLREDVNAPQVDEQHACRPSEQETCVEPASAAERVAGSEELKLEPVHEDVRPKSLDNEDGIMSKPHCSLVVTGRPVRDRRGPRHCNRNESDEKPLLAKRVGRRRR